MKIFTPLIITFFLLSSISFSQIYVDITRPDNNGTGDSWSTAYRDLQDALTNASSGDVIYVAQGTYYPDEGTGQTDNNAASTFQMIDSVDIYGGYPTGGGTRDPSAYATILSGDLDQSDTKNTNDSYHVVMGADSSTIDGFTITGGNARDPEFHGAGMFNSSVSPTINNCIFTDNSSVFGGAGMYNNNSSPTISGCKFENNNAQGSGGGIFITSASSNIDITDCTFLNNQSNAHGGGINIEYSSGTITLSDCIFQSNTTTSYGGGLRTSSDTKVERCTFNNNSTTTGGNGGGIYLGGDAEIVNCVFINNTANVYGGGIDATTYDPIVRHCTFLNNTAGTAGDGFIRSGSTTSTITNSILWGSDAQIAGDYITVTYSDIQQSSGEYTGTGNINLDPSFISSTNLHLEDNSPCIGAGTDLSISDDRDGNPRPAPAATNPDMGAYENLLDAPLPVELSSFTAEVNGMTVELRWRTETEVNNYGFEIDRCIENKVWEKIGFIEGNGNSNSPKLYSYTDKPLTGGCKFSYRLKQIDSDGKYEYSNIIEVELTPNHYELTQNYPNPFNPITTIQYSIPALGKVKIILFNLLGEKIKTLIDEEKMPGNYEVEFNAVNIPSGVYFYQLKAGDFVQTKKMILMK
jgi:parallel beta-helix repeat protein/predicted outer membrane repeat protein